MSAEAYTNWVARTTFERTDGDIHRVVSSRRSNARSVMESEYADCVRSAIRELELAVLAESL